MARNCNLHTLMCEDIIYVGDCTTRVQTGRLAGVPIVIAGQ